jgi:DNA-binding transcriptional ArsR family regulator
MDEERKGTPDVEKTEELMVLVGDPIRRQILSLLDNMKELNVEDLSEMLGLSVRAAQQHLGKLRAYGLVAARRDAQTLYYWLTDHPFNQKLREP